LGANDEIRITEKSRELTLVKAALEASTRGVIVSWLNVDEKALSGKVTERPTREAIPVAAQEQLIVELYSK